MKVLIVNNAVPFVRGGAELLAENLLSRLNSTAGVEAELLRIPFNWQPAERLIEEIVLNRKLRLVNVDKVIALKFPAYLIPHPNKTLWLLHQFRQAYDLLDSGQSFLQRGGRGGELVQAIRTADNACFAECRRIFANSPVTKDRLLRYNGFHSTVLYPPLNDPESFAAESYEKFIFAGGRINRGKRQHMLVDAMRYVTQDVKLVIAGPPDTDEDAQTLRELVATHDLESRVVLQFGFHSRARIAHLVNNCLACAVIPIDEDSLSYVAMEAFCASKAVVTTRDAGGPLEIVKDGASGVIVDADARSIGEAVNRLASQPRNAQAMGQTARSIWLKMNLDWTNTVEALLSDH